MDGKQNTYSYNGYFGSAEISHEDQCLVGQILYIDDLVMYEGSSYEELKAAFKSSVDDYLAFCAQVGKEPHKTYSGSFNVRIGSDLHGKAARAATNAKMSLNDYVKQAIAQSVNKVHEARFVSADTSQNEHIAEIVASFNAQIIEAGTTSGFESFSSHGSGAFYLQSLAAVASSERGSLKTMPVFKRMQLEQNQIRIPASKLPHKEAA